MPTPGSRGPAALPSKAAMWIAASPPNAEYSASAIPMSLLLTSSDGLGVEIQQAAVRVVCLLQHVVRCPVVRRPELLFGVVRRRVQRLAPAEASNGDFDV